MEIIVKNEKLFEEIKLDDHGNVWNWKKKISEEIEEQQKRNRHAYGMEQYRQYGRDFSPK